MTRPRSLKSETTRIRTAHGGMYVTAAFDENSMPCEVFITLGKAGGCDHANVEALARVIALALRCGASIDAVINQLSGLTCCPIWDDARQIRSVPDGVAAALSRYRELKAH